MANLSFMATTDSQNAGLPWFYILLFLILYLIVVALFRRQRVRGILHKFPYTTRHSFASMTNEDAFYIQRYLSELEFPFTIEKALQFALFRTYGIPSISKLLVETRQFSEPATATKRYTDTGVLISEFATCHPHDDRSVDAIARMNFIHSVYQKAGKILDDDMLYTLSLFTVEPIRWTARFEWRELEDFEKCALAVFWKSIGDAMGISYDKLKSGGENGPGWTDGLQWLDEMAAWSLEYEKRFMVPANTNRQTAEETVAILLWGVPNALKPYGRKVVSALMDDRLRAAMIYPAPPQIYFTLVEIIFSIRKYLIRYLSPPRPDFMKMRMVTDEPSPDDRYFMKTWETLPWYVKPTMGNRYSLQALKSRIMGLPAPGDEGLKYWPQGYKIHEIGPDMLRGKGATYQENAKPKIASSLSGCPFGRLKRE